MDIDKDTYTHNIFLLSLFLNMRKKYEMLNALHAFPENSYVIFWQMKQEHRKKKSGREQNGQR